MKKKFYIIPIMVTVLFITYGCPEKDVEPDSTITIVNNSPDSLLWWIGFRLVDDTLLTSHSLFPDESTKREFLLLPDSIVKEKDSFIGGLNYNKKHIIMLFLFSLRDVEQYPWDTIRENYIIKRRYDLTREDLDRLEWTVKYP